MLKKNTPIEIILTVILALLCIYTAYKAYTLKEKVEYITDTITVTDTITNLDYDTIYLSRYDTAYLSIVDTVNDTVTKIDSILVQIPISTSVYDTSIRDTNYETNLRAVLSGFNTSVDTLTIHTKIMPQEPQIAPNRWYNNFGFGIGIGVGYKDGGIFLAPTIGIMYRFHK